MRRRPMSARLVLLVLTAALTLGLAATVAASAGHVELVARMSGSQEVPPTDLDGTGRATLDLRLETGEICWAVEFSRIGAPNRGHIHAAPAGVNGGIVVALIEIVTDPANPLHDQLERGRAKGCVTADPVLVADIAENPANYYVNLHNARFPAGAIRGQLSD